MHLMWILNATWPGLWMFTTLDHYLLLYLFEKCSFQFCFLHLKSVSSYISGNITKKLPRRTVVPVSDTVIFCVELEHPYPDAYWTRNGEKLKEDSRISIGCVLRQYTLTIRDCQAEDSGEVAFVAGDCKTSTRFSVTGGLNVVWYILMISVVNIYKISCGDWFKFNLFYLYSAKSFQQLPQGGFYCKVKILQY